MKHLPVMNIGLNMLNHENINAVSSFLHEMLDFCGNNNHYEFECSISTKQSDVTSEEPPF